MKLFSKVYDFYIIQCLGFLLVKQLQMFAKEVPPKGL